MKISNPRSPRTDDSEPGQIGNPLTAFLRSEDGPTSVEYCVMLAMILLVIIVTITAFGQGQAGFWGDIDSQMTDHGI